MDSHYYELYIWFDDKSEVIDILPDRNEVLRAIKDWGNILNFEQEEFNVVAHNKRR